MAAPATFLATYFPVSEGHGIEEVQPRVGPDGDFAKHRPDAVARVDGYRALSTDGELRLVLPSRSILTAYWSWPIRGSV